MEKNIIFFNFSDAGFYSHRAAYAEKLIKNGWNVFLISQVKNHKTRLEKIGIKVIKIPIKNRYNFNPINLLKIVLFLRKKIKQINPKVLNNIGIVPMILGTWSSFGLSMNISNSLTGLGSLVITKNYKNIILLFILKHIFTNFLKKTNIIVQNKTDYNFFKNLGFESKKVFLVPGYGIQTKYYRKSHQKNKIPKIVLHSRLLKVKGIYEFYKASKIINKKKLKAKFYLFGSPDENNPDSISIKDIKSLEKPYFKYMGADNQIKYKLNNFDIACLPSYREGLPRSLLESMASKLPIVTTNTPGNSDVVINGLNGFKVKAKSSIHLSNALKKLIYNKKIRLDMGFESLNLCEKKFSTLIIFKKLDKIFE